MIESQKSQYETTSRYGNTQHLVHLKTRAVFFNRAEADRLADKAFTGGYNLKKTNLCSECFTYKSENGTCNC
jgi:hypothetical protein